MKYIYTDLCVCRHAYTHTHTYTYLGKHFFVPKRPVPVCLHKVFLGLLHVNICVSLFTK